MRKRDRLLSKIKNLKRNIRILEGFETGGVSVRDDEDDYRLREMDDDDDYLDDYLDDELDADLDIDLLDDDIDDDLLDDDIDDYLLDDDVDDDYLLDDDVDDIDDMIDDIEDDVLGEAVRRVKVKKKGALRRQSRRGTTRRIGRRY